MSELRTGYTTGTCAAAATKAGLLHLLHGQTLTEVDTPLPNGERLVIPIERMDNVEGTVRTVVIKDGGDDPDATNGAEIHALVSVFMDVEKPTLFLKGGKGVGVATLPGLPIGVDEPAINPVPRKQIVAAAQEALEGQPPCTVEVVIEVPDGERIAKNTMNPQLGIKGGISILGTQGIVKPYSHSAWKASVDMAMDMAKAQGLDHIVFSTGRRSERLWQEAHPDAHPQTVIQAADFFAHSMKGTAKRGFKRVTWSLFFGKLVKHAQGLEYTHARTAPVDFDFLAGLAQQAGAPPEAVSEIREAVTARRAFELLKDDPSLSELIDTLIVEASFHAKGFANGAVDVDYVLFDFEGDRLN